MPHSSSDMDVPGLKSLLSLMDFLVVGVQEGQAVTTILAAGIESSVAVSSASGLAASVVAGARLPRWPSPTSLSIPY